MMDGYVYGLGGGGFMGIYIFSNSLSCINEICTAFSSQSYTHKENLKRNLLLL